MLITPAIQPAGWHTIEQIYREYTVRPGRVVVRGNHASRDKKSIRRADYVLFYETSIPLVVVEAKAVASIVFADSLRNSVHQ